MSRHDILLLRQDLLWFLVQMIPTGYWNKTMSKRGKLKCAYLNLLPVLHLKNLSCGVIRGKEADLTHQFYSIRQEENKKESKTEEGKVSKFMKIINKVFWGEVPCKSPTKLITDLFYPSDSLPVFLNCLGVREKRTQEFIRCSLVVLDFIIFLFYIVIFPYLLIHYLYNLTF